MKIREIRLQNGIFVYKAGISFTKWDFHLQRETLGLQTGLSLYISPNRFICYIYYTQKSKNINNQNTNSCKNNTIGSNLHVQYKSG